MKDLREKTIRGGFARIAAQGINFLVRFGSLVVLARLLGPQEFGLVGMVTAFTGVLTLFRDFGLSSAAVQRGEVTEAQTSTLFWINLLVGAVLGLITVAAAPAISAFYGEPKLLGVAIALASGFVLNAAGVQHSVILLRELRFTTLAAVNTVSLLVSNALAIASAAAGFGYWALVIMMITNPLVTTIGCWVTTAWIPGRPQRRVGLAGLARFGGTVTLNGIVYYAACNFDKVLLGRVWGVEALGLYGRAYQLISIPSENLNSAASEVAFSALSRLQADPVRLKNYFLKGYALLLTLTIPVTLWCGAFADDVIIVALGSKWSEAAPVFRLLAPAMLGFAVVNPTHWLLIALGLVGRSLTMALVIAPLMIAAFVAGLPYGPVGVATAYSTVMLLWAIPALAWAVAGTPVSLRDMLVAISRPLAASILAAACAAGARLLYLQALSPMPRLVLESAIFFSIFAGTLVLAMGQRTLYLDLIRPARRAA